MPANPTLIFLTGFMGCGKSTLGPILANVFGYDFVDLDHEIEKSAGRPIKQIFEENGRDYFRKLEREALQSLLEKTETFVSLGGGAIADDINRKKIQKSGILVYIQVETDVLTERLGRKNTRPLLCDEAGEVLEPEALKKQILDLMATRQSNYESANIVVKTGEMRIGYTVDHVAKKIIHYQRKIT